MSGGSTRAIRRRWALGLASLLAASALVQIGGASGASADTVSPVGFPVTMDLSQWIADSVGDRATGVGVPSAGYRFAIGLGGVYQSSSVPGTHAIYECVTGTDRFTSTDAGCEGQSLVARLGWIYDSAPTFPVTLPLIRCSRTGFADHYDTTWGCFSGDTQESVLGYVVAAYSLSRFYSSSAGDHQSYTTEASPGYAWEKGLGEVWLASTANTHALYACESNGDHFTSTDSRCGGASGGGPNNILGYAYDPNARPSWLPTVPLYACAVLASGEQFDSNDPGCEGQRNDGFLGWVLGYQTLTRLLNTATGDHATRVSNPNGAYQWEQTLGGVYLPDASPRPSGTHAIYECETTANNAPDQFTSVDPNCQGLTSLGILGYVYDAPPSGVPTMPLYRCHTATWEHFDSNDPGCEGQAQQELLGYTLAGFPVDSAPPSLAITHQPGVYWNSASASIDFTLSDPNSTPYAYCALDSNVFDPCTTGATFGPLADGPHVLQIYAIDDWQNVSPLTKITWTVDTVAPHVAMTAPSVAFTLSSPVKVAWSGADNPGGVGIRQYEPRYQVANFNSTGFGGWQYPTMWQGTVSSSITVPVSRGSDYCFSVQAWDQASNASPWAPVSCVAVPLDDRALTASSGWTRATGRSYWNGTVTRTTRLDATLHSATAYLDRVGIVATRCSTCGEVAVYVGRTRVGVINLHGTTTRYRRLITLARFSYRRGVVTLKVVTSGKSVQIDGLAISRT